MMAELRSPRLCAGPCGAMLYPGEGHTWDPMARGLRHDPPCRAPAPAPTAWDPDVERALVAAGEALAVALTPMAWALQEARAGAAELLGRYVQTYEALAALVGALDAGTVRANWAADQAILDTARDLVDRLSPIPTTNGDDRGDSTPDPAG